jgi:tRNA G46 methylase TrmB
LNSTTHNDADQKTNNSDLSYYHGQRQEMLKYIPDSAKLFLELGCSAGGFGAMLKATRKNAYVIGVEIHSQSAEAARMRLDEVIEKPVEIALEAIPGGSVLISVEF